MCLMNCPAAVQPAEKSFVSFVRKYRFGALKLGALALVLGANAAMPTGSTIGNYTGRKLTLLAIDDYSLPLRRDLCYYLSKPQVRAEPVLTPSRGNPQATDDVATHFYGTVLQENGKFRMWYYGVGWAEKPTDKDIETTKLREGPICYAESDDGLHWTKPNLGQVTHGGGSANNAISLPEKSTEGAFVIRDDDDPDPARRYKMVYENRHASNRFMSVGTATSADGIHWKSGPASPIGEGLEPCAFYRHGGLYFINAQFAPRGVSEGGSMAGRQGFVWVSTDFNTWLQESGESFLLPEPADPNDRGLDRPGMQVHLGVGAVSQGNVLVGLYCQWNSQPKNGDWFGRGTTTGDFGLVVSNDGQHFREPVKGHVFMPRGASRAAVTPGIRHQQILQQSGNGIITVGDETRIYHGRWVNPEKLENYYAEIAVATLPRDRWGALGLYPRAADGAVWTAPITLTQAAAITLNAQGVRGMRVEIADANFKLLPDYSGDNAGSSRSADGLDCPVAWTKSGLDALAGQTVRFRIQLKRGDYAEPRLFALYVTSP